MAVVVDELPVPLATSGRMLPDMVDVIGVAPAVDRKRLPNDVRTLLRETRRCFVVPFLVTHPRISALAYTYGASLETIEGDVIDVT